MQMMYCIEDPFVFGLTVYARDNETSNITRLFSGSKEEVCQYMAEESNNNKYERILLHSIDAEEMKETIYQYSMTKYNNTNIRIEVA